MNICPGCLKRVDLVPLIYIVVSFKANEATNELIELHWHKSCYDPALLTDSQGRTWHVMEREDKSISIYYTIGNSPAHYVVFDSPDAGLDESEAAGD